MDKLEKFIIKELKKYNVIENKVVLLIEEDGSKLAQAVREGMKLDDKLLCQILAGWCLGTICNQKKCCNARRLKSLKLALASQIKELIKW